MQEAEPSARIVYKVHQTKDDIEVGEVRRTWVSVPLPTAEGDELMGVAVGSAFSMSHVQLVNDEGVVMWQGRPDGKTAQITIDDAFFGVMRKCLKVHFIRSSRELQHATESIDDYLVHVASTYDETFERVTTVDGSGKRALKLSAMPLVEVHVKLADGKTQRDMEVAMGGTAKMAVVCVTRRLEPQ